MILEEIVDDERMREEGNPMFYRSPTSVLQSPTMAIEVNNAYAPHALERGTCDHIGTGGLGGIANCW